MTVKIVENYYLVRSIEKRFGDLVSNLAHLNVDTDYHVSPQSDKQGAVKAEQLPSPAFVSIFT